MEPERKIEKLLRAYAEKRRAEAGDPLTLHPANRRILQGEVARLAPKPEEGGKGNLFLLLFAVFRRRLVFALCAVAIVFLGGSMFLPALSSAKKKAQSLGAANHLKEIGRAARQYASDNKEMLPASLDEVTNGLVTQKELTDTVSGKPFVYAGAGKKLDVMQSNEVLAYSPADKKDRQVLFADGRVETVTGARFAELTNQKPVEFALAGKSERERPAETPPATAPPGPEKTKIDLATEEAKAGDLEVNTRSAGEPASRQPEPAKSEPVATSAPVSTVGGLVSGVGPTTLANGSISGKLPAAENSDAVAKNQLFDRLVMQTNSVPQGFASAQNFVQTGVSGMQNLFRNRTASAQAMPVLQSFQVQQNGNVISVVDRDGSIYHGDVQTETGTVRNEPAPAETFAPPGTLPQAAGKAGQAVGNEQQTAQNYFFRVAGMNRTLKQNVVFTGSFLANNVTPQTVQTSNFPGAVGGGGGGGGGGAAGQIQQAAVNQSQQNLLSNSRIVGTAVIASTNRIEVNAVPVTP